MARRVNAGRKVVSRRVLGANAEETLGFGDVEIIAAEGGLTYEQFFQRLTQELRSRNIDWMEPSDALDMSRDLILDDVLGHEYQWEIVGSTLRIWPSGYTFDWDKMGQRKVAATAFRRQARRISASVSKSDARAVVDAIVEQWGGFVDGSAPPTLVQNLDPDAEWTVVWEEGPFQWSYYFPYGGVEQEFGTEVEDVFALLPDSVFVETLNHYAVNIYPSSVLD
jgi:hypothetical protein